MFTKAGEEVILAALYLVNQNRETIWVSQDIRVKIAVRQNGYSEITCDNLAVDTGTNLGSPSCKETDESNQCQPVFLIMKNVYMLEMIVEKFG